MDVDIKEALHVLADVVTILTGFLTIAKAMKGK